MLIWSWLLVGGDADGDDGGISKVNAHKSASTFWVNKCKQWITASWKQIDFNAKIKYLLNIQHTNRENRKPLKHSTNIVQTRIQAHTHSCQRKLQNCFEDSKSLVWVRAIEIFEFCLKCLLAKGHENDIQHSAFYSCIDWKFFTFFS